MLDYPFSKRDKDILKREMRDILPDLLFDAFWNKIGYFSTIFEAADGYDVINSGSGAGGTVDPDGIIISTGPTNTNNVTIRRAPNPTLGSATQTQTFLNFKEVQRFRANFALNSVSDVTAYVTRGADVGNTYPYYGFKIVNATLKGVCRDNNSDGEATIDLLTVSADTAYQIEARLLPGQKVDFYVVDNDTNKLNLEGTLTTKLPKVSSANDKSLLEYFISTQADADKILSSSFFEYMQVRTSYITS